MTSFTTQEIVTQPAMWQRTVEVAAKTPADVLPKPGESIAVVGCGTSWFIAESYCKLREAKGQGVSDSYTATELPFNRDYDRVICLSRSGTTSEIVNIANKLQGKVPTLLITAVADGPTKGIISAEVVLDFADEQSVVQTRFATSALTFFRATLGENLGQPMLDAQEAIDFPIPSNWVQAEQISFLGTGWTHGIAQEAALKLREASQSWTECYYAMEYRHGPISIAQPGRIVWVFGEAPKGLDAQVAETGAEFVTWEGDPVSMLILAQRLAVERAKAKGLNPDTPRHLTRAVILPD